MAYQLSQGTLTLAILTIGLTLLGRFLYVGYQWRRLAHKMPGAPHSWIFGHALLMGDVVRSQPRGIAPQSLPLVLKYRYNLPDLFYLDVWPFGPPAIVCTHPDISNQFILKPSMPKHPVTGEFTGHFSGGGDMVATSGNQWKIWRSAFNPGFSASHLMTLLPYIVDDVAIFACKLHDFATKNELFRLEPHATRLTIDIIGKIVLDGRFNSQLGEHELVSAFESQVRWIPIGNMVRPLEVFNVFRPFVMRWNRWRMDRYVGNVLEERFASRKNRAKTKHIIDLALETYLKENPSADRDSSGLDKTFKEAAIKNIKIFIFAGHDTSSSAICYAFYQLSRNPETLARLRKECDDIFGTDLSKTGDLIKADPYLLNKMEYGLAVIREILRLHPPASSARIGSRDFFITDPKTGERYPTEGWMLWPQNVGMHYSESIWGPDAMSFRPERWLSSSAPMDAWIPFSKGIRNCIGQELALLELRMVLAMTVRQFDFQVAFDEVEKLKGDGTGYSSDTSGVQEQFGEQAYQIQLGTAKPREGMPCRMSVAKR